MASKDNTHDTAPDTAAREVKAKRRTRHADRWVEPGETMWLTPDQIELKRRHGELEE